MTLIGVGNPNHNDSPVVIVACIECCRPEDVAVRPEPVDQFEVDNDCRLYVMHAHHAAEYALKGWSTKPEDDGSFSMFCPHLDWSGLA